MIFFSKVFITRRDITIIKIMKLHGQMRLMQPQLLSFGISHRLYSPDLGRTLF